MSLPTSPTACLGDPEDKREPLEVREDVRDNSYGGKDSYYQTCSKIHGPQAGHDWRGHHCIRSAAGNIPANDTEASSIYVRYTGFQRQTRPAFLGPMTREGMFETGIRRTGIPAGRTSFSHHKPFNRGSPGADCRILQGYLGNHRHEGGHFHVLPSMILVLVLVAL